jgi:cytochrome b pre-mRNA-processing protein 3
MLSRFFGQRRERARIATILYGAIVAQARAPALYADLGVPDTVSGRFEMVVLHAVLLIGRLRAGGARETAAGQAVFDLFCVDMDRSLRELGIGDLGVPKKMRQVGEAFYGRARVYDDCLARRDEVGLASALRRNVLTGLSDDSAAAPLARYALAAAERLAKIPPSTLLDEAVPFPDPAAWGRAAAGAAV